MHELSFAEQILDTVQREAAAYPDTRIIRIRLRAGELLGIEPASLEFCLKAISAGTVANTAEIEIEPVPGGELIIQEIELHGQDSQT